MLIQDVKEFIEPYVSLDIPVQYKDLEIKPILVKDSLTFLRSYDILNIEKNRIPDAKIIQMSYLQYIVDQLMFDDTMTEFGFSVGDIWKEKFITILSLCIDVKSENISLINDGRLKITLGDKIIDADDFENIRRIILYQNINGFDDTPISEDFRKNLEKYYAIKNYGMKMPTMDDKMDVVMSCISMNDKDIKNMTYRRFERVFERIVSKNDYMVGALFQSQGAKGSLEHWVFKKEKDKYSEAFTKMGAVKQSIN